MEENKKSYYRVFFNILDSGNGLRRIETSTSLVFQTPALYLGTPHQIALFKKTAFEALKITRKEMNSPYVFWESQIIYMGSERIDAGIIEKLKIEFHEVVVGKDEWLS